MLRERHKRQIHRVQHQLNRHKDNDGIPPQQHSHRPNRKQDRTENKVVMSRDHSFAFSATKGETEKWENGEMEKG